MKKLIFTTLTLAIALATQAQTPAENLKKATDALNSKDYVASLNALSAARKDIMTLWGEQFLATLPAKFNDFEAQPNTNPSGGIMQGFSKTYNKPVKEEAPATPVPPATGETAVTTPPPSSSRPMGSGMNMESITATISQNPMAVNTIMALHTPEDENTNSSRSPGGATMGMRGMGGDAKAIKIKGYKASQAETNMGYKMQTVSVLLGTTVVELRGMNLPDASILIKFIEGLDLEKIKTLGGDK